MSPMLERYLASTPTIAEKLLLLSTPKTTAVIIVDKVDGTKAPLEEGQPSWNKRV